MSVTLTSGFFCLVSHFKNFVWGSLLPEAGVLCVKVTTGDKLLYLVHFKEFMSESPRAVYTNPENSAGHR